MRARTLVAVAAMLTLLALPQPTHAQQTPGYSLTLSATLDPVSPISPNEVRAGTEITYRIEHTVPSPVPDVEYYFKTPPGTVFVEARVLEGADLVRTQSGPETPLLAGPEGLADVVIYAEPTAPTGSIEVTVRVNNTYQGAINGIARFLGRGPGDIGAGSSNALTFQFDHGDGVPGQLVASSFVDFNGNAVFDQDEVPQSCAIYVYSDLTGTRIPDSLSEPTDASLPLASVGATTADGPARINLFPGRYSVLYGACDTPLSPTGNPFNAYEPVDRPPVTRISNESGTVSYEIQTFDIVSTEITEVVRAAQPIDALAPPTDLRFNGAQILTWTDRADGEDGYQIDVSGTVITQLHAPPNSEGFTLPASFYICGFNDIMVSVTATLGGATGYPVTAQYIVVSDCAFPPPLFPPNTGAGHTSSANVGLIALIATLGAAFATTGVVLRTRPFRQPPASDLQHLTS